VGVGVGSGGGVALGEAYGVGGIKEPGKRGAGGIGMRLGLGLGVGVGVGDAAWSPAAGDGLAAGDSEPGAA